MQLNINSLKTKLDKLKEKFLSYVVYLRMR